MSEETTTENNSEDVSGLKAKIAELHGLLKGEKARADKAMREAEEAADNASNQNSTELEKAVKRAEKAEKAVKDAEERAQTVERNLRDTRANNALNSALAAANVDAKAMPFLVKGMRADIEFSDDGQPLLSGKSVADYIKDFTSPKGEGHQFVRAPNNGGGAAVGYTGGGGAQPIMTKETWNASKFAQLVIEDREQAKALAIACGKEDIARTL